MITLVIPIKPFFVTRGQRIPNLNQVSYIRISRAEDAFTLDVIELETLAVNRGEVDCNGVEVAFREIVGDIADRKSATDLHRLCKSVAESMCCENAAKGRKRNLPE